MIVYESVAEIEQLIAGFENGSLPAIEWTHQAHLTMAIWYLSKHERATATKLICDGIRQYVLATGKQNTDTDGYHETITLFYIWFVNKFLTCSNAGNSLVENTNNFCRLYGDKNLPLHYYSRELLMSVEARRNWVEPDLKFLE
jgi:hypothetical protein